MMHPPHKKFTKILLISVLALVLAGTVLLTNADEIIYGSVTVDPPVALENIIIHDGATIQTSLNPDGTSQYYLNFSINRPGGMNEIKFIDIYWHSNTYTTTYNTSTVDGIELVHGRWTENLEIGGFPTGIDEWTFDSAGYTEWNFGAPTDPNSDSSLTTFTFEVPFTVSRAALPGSGWQVSIDITWDDDSTLTGSSSAWTVLIRQSLAVSTNTIAWGNVIQDTGLVTTSINVTVYSNTQWSLQIKGADFLSAGEPTVGIDSGPFVVVNGTDTVTSTFTGLTSLTSQGPMGEVNSATYTLTFAFDSTNWPGTYGSEYTIEITLKLISG
jgi:hypothetical protein